MSVKIKTSWRDVGRRVSFDHVQTHYRSSSGTPRVDDGLLQSVLQDEFEEKAKANEYDLYNEINLVWNREIHPKASAQWIRLEDAYDMLVDLRNFWAERRTFKGFADFFLAIKAPCYIIGAGPAGLLVALFCGFQKKHVVVFEQRAEYTRGQVVQLREAIVRQIQRWIDIAETKPFKETNNALLDFIQKHYYEVRFIYNMHTSDYYVAIQTRVLQTLLDTLSRCAPFNEYITLSKEHNAIVTSNKRLSVTNTTSTMTLPYNIVIDASGARSGEKKDLVSIQVRNETDHIYPYHCVLFGKVEDEALWARIRELPVFDSVQSAAMLRQTKFKWSLRRSPIIRVFPYVLADENGDGRRSIHRVYIGTEIPAKLYNIGNTMDDICEWVHHILGTKSIVFDAEDEEYQKSKNFFIGPVACRETAWDDRDVVSIGDALITPHYQTASGVNNAFNHAVDVDDHVLKNPNRELFNQFMAKKAQIYASKVWTFLMDPSRNGPELFFRN